MSIDLKLQSNDSVWKQEDSSTLLYKQIIKAIHPRE